MKSYWMQLAATGAVLELRESPVPQPGAGQLLVRMCAAGLNRGEFVHGHGLHGQHGTWKAIGAEGAGEVAAVGSGVTAFSPGDRVMGRCAGAFSEYALMEAAEAMDAPLSLTWEEAAAIPLTFLVAYDMLVLQGRVQPGDWVLVNGASSGVGVASLQLAKLLHARVLGTSGSAAKLQALKPLGLDVGICTREADFAPAVMDATAGHGADLAINAVGGSVFAENIRALAYEGRLATVGYVDGVLHAQLDLEALHTKRLVLFGVSNKRRTKAQRANTVASFAQQVLPHISAGRLRPYIDQVLDFHHLPEGKAHMERGGHVGKIVLRMAAGSLNIQSTRE